MGDEAKEYVLNEDKKKYLVMKLFCCWAQIKCYQRSIYING